MTSMRADPRLETVERERWRIVVHGAVQGVGFRPSVHRRATELGLTGWVINSAEGVVVKAEGNPKKMAALVEHARDSPPSHSRVDFVDLSVIAPRWDSGF